MASITGISPDLGSPYGGQSVTLTGTAFGASQGTGGVTVEGRPATVTAWSDTSVTFTAPARRTGSTYSWGGGAVAVVLTTAPGATASATYTYKGAIVETALQTVRANLAALSVQGGAFFNWSAAQVRPVKMDSVSLDNGANFPQAIVYQPDGEPRVEESSHGFLITRHNCIAQAVMPMATMEDWDIQLGHLLADLYAGIMADVSQGGTCFSTDYTSFDKGRIDAGQDGSMGVASISFVLTVQTAYNDFTRNHSYTVT